MKVKTEEKAKRALSRYFSELFGRKFEIGLDELPSKGPELTKERLNKIFHIIQTENIFDQNKLEEIRHRVNPA